MNQNETNTCSQPQTIRSDMIISFIPTPYLALNTLTQDIHRLAWEKGWHSHDEPEDQYIKEFCNNEHDEVSELHDAWRQGNLNKFCDKAQAMADARLPQLTCKEEELADIIIRALDAAGKMGVDIARAVYIKHEFNKTRSRRHGGKLS